ncbi:DUF3131 domain-containing protein [Vibrio cionasavignyae]|uniref:DUF3131 domain-containing protein n=1 Tax=Vibrio cionasavignyae TaxID=2910252 RepID=UPI003D103FF2
MASRLIRYFFITLLSAASVHADTDAPELPSFYGGRSVAPGETAKEATAIDYQRRALAPPILPEDTIEEYNKANSSPSPLIVMDEYVHNQELFLADIQKLSRNDWLLARKAQHYFQKNYHEPTGMWDSVQGYHHATMWDIASGLAATLALHALELETTEITRDRLRTTLTTLADFPLYKTTLPNREYSAKTGLPSGSYSTSSSNGNGWSALDIGRLLIWLKITEAHFPELSPIVQDITSRWTLSAAIKKKTLYGTKLYKGKEYFRQEGRLGYLQYAAQGYALYGFDLSASYDNTTSETITVDGMDLHVDTRNVPYFTSDPYVLLALEIGRPQVWWNQLDALYQLQKKRSTLTNKLHIYAEDAMSKSPWFAYNNIYYYGTSWLSVSPGGKPIETPQRFSNKVGFGFSVLFDDTFSTKLRDEVLRTSLNARSIPTGIYTDNGTNNAFNINTNSLVLVSLWYKALGKTPILEASMSQRLQWKNQVSEDQTLRIKNMNDG